MKFSEKWLREWIDIKIHSHILYDQISNSGIELEYVKKFKPIFKGVVVGKIINCVKHLNNSNLNLIKVDIATDILDIICAASNCRLGIKVAVAKVGATLPNNTKINKKTIKGAISRGMLCSFFDLGMFHTNKIIELSQEVPIGEDVNNYLLLKDNIIKVSSTPNRPDSLSILGISRNIAALNNFKIPVLKHKSVPVKTNKKINIDIHSKNECKNCISRIIQNVNLNIETPFWIKKKLFFSDILSVNIITDIINYVLIAFGQPLHVFNIDNINSDIIIRMAKEREKIVLSDKSKIDLNEKILVFSDQEKVLSLPGNINSDFIEIKKNTKNILLSSFLIEKNEISYIIKKIKSNKILEYYHYGIDPSLQCYAIEYATDLILKICGGKAGPIVQENNKNSNISSFSSKIKLYYKKLNEIAGFFIKKIDVSKILYNLDYKFILKKEYCEITPPTWRFDILIEEDIIGEILRIYRYDKIPLIALQETYNLKKYNSFKDTLSNQFSNILINKGYFEIITYGFVDPEIQNIIFPKEKKLLISNPISQDMSSMRISLWPGLIKTVVYNQNRQQNNVRFFEIGLCFLIDETKNLDVKQEIFLSAVISGNYIQESCFFNKRKIDFYDLKGDLECVLESICNLNDIEFKSEIITGLHPRQGAAIYFKNNYIGSIGAIDPRLSSKLNINNSVFLFEISLNSFSKIKKSKIKDISKFPSVRRDLAVLISKNIPAADVINTCKKFFSNKSVEINLFDVYFFGDFLDTQKSLGISFTFQDMKKTLEENEINLMMNACIGVLIEKFQITLRK